MSDYRDLCLREKGEACTVCGSDKNVVAHHIDADREHNDIENLVPLCASCHARLHSTNDPPDELRELWEQLPDYARANRPDRGITSNRKGISVHGETKARFKDLVRDGVTHDYTLRWLLDHAEDARSILYKHKEHPYRCPNCLTPGDGEESYEAALLCPNEECPVVNFTADAD